MCTCTSLSGGVLRAVLQHFCYSTCRAFGSRKFGFSLTNSVDPLVGLEPANRLRSWPASSA